MSGGATRQRRFRQRFPAAGSPLLRKAGRRVPFASRRKLRRRLAVPHQLWPANDATNLACALQLDGIAQTTRTSAAKREAILRP